MNIGELAQLSWRAPWWGLLALVPLLLAILLRLRRDKVRHYADAALLPWAMEAGFDTAGDRRRRLIYGIAWILLACAAAGPRAPLVLSDGTAAQAALQQRHEMDVMVVMDVSLSMGAGDVSPDRLQRGKLELEDWLTHLRGERIGLVVYSGSAGVLMPLGQDYRVFRFYLAQVSSTLFANGGNDLAGALDLARTQLSRSRATSRAVLLVSDAEASALSGPAGAAVAEEVEHLRQAGVRLFVLGVGTTQGATIPLRDGGEAQQDGAPVISRMDGDGFAQLAQSTGGAFTPVEDGDGDWRQLYDNGILTLPGDVPRKEEVRAWRELYGWFLLPALLLFILARVDLGKTPASSGTTMLLVLGLAAVFPHQAKAADDVMHSAFAAYSQKQYARAQTLYGGLHGYAARMGEGAAAYRRKDYPHAVRQYTTALLLSVTPRERADALYNLGNSFYRMNNLRAAGDAYQDVLRERPTDGDARHNLAVVSARMAADQKRDAYSEGILGRRGRGTGGEQGVDMADKPVSIEPDKRTEGPEVGGTVGEGTGPGGLAHRVPGSARDPDETYRAAAKKLELLTDPSARLQKGMLQVERPQREPAEGTRW
jgi:Ca-activated chloride channel family protein